MHRLLYALTFLLIAGCASTGTGPDEDPESTTPPEGSGEMTNGETLETTGEGTGGEGAVARELLAGNEGTGPTKPEVRVAFSARALGDDLGARVPDRGAGAYVAALWGRKNTGGYSLGLAGARERGGRTVLLISREEPPRGAMVTQAITYPYVVVFVPGAEPRPGNIVAADESGADLGWPLVVVGGGG